MKLYFLRHGIAQDDDGAISDHLRALTPEGIEAMNKVAKGLRAMKVQPTHLFTSPPPMIARIVMLNVGS